MNSAKCAIKDDQLPNYITIPLIYLQHIWAQATTTNAAEKERRQAEFRTHVKLKMHSAQKHAGAPMGPYYR